MNSLTPTIVWFRQDLRLSDHPALHAALQQGQPVIPLYIWDTEPAKDWRPGGAERVWLEASLRALQQDLEALQSRLIIRQGNTLSCLLDVARQSGARRIDCNARYEPWARQQQETLQRALVAEGIELRCHRGGSLIFEPDSVQTGDGKPYQVFTPFLKKCLQALPDVQPLPVPRHIPAPVEWPDSLPVEALALRPRIQWDVEMRDYWQPGEIQAHLLLQHFISQKQDTYAEARDIPSIDGTSRLSPYLSHGEISARQIWHAVSEDGKRSGHAFLREIAWREFAYHVLYHFPHTTDRALKPKFNQLPWQLKEEWLERWRKGQTGYPIVDAGMRQLWRIGWMHNRVRMIVGSFLTKDLLISWQDGTRWFWDTLVDADLA